MADYVFMAVWTQTVCNNRIGSVGPRAICYIQLIPDLLWNQNRVYGLVWYAVVPTNEGLPVADYDFMAAWNLYCMYQPYWVCVSKGNLVHKAHKPLLLN